jgi:hypothetical protein
MFLNKIYDDVLYSTYSNNNTSLLYLLFLLIMLLNKFYDDVLCSAMKFKVNGASKTGKPNIKFGQLGSDTQQQ